MTPNEILVTTLDNIVKVPSSWSDTVPMIRNIFPKFGKVWRAYVVALLLGFVFNLWMFSKSDFRYRKQIFGEIIKNQLCIGKESIYTCICFNYSSNMNQLSDLLIATIGV